MTFQCKFQCNARHCWGHERWPLSPGIPECFISAWIWAPTTQWRDPGHCRQWIAILHETQKTFNPKEYGTHSCHCTVKELSAPNRNILWGCHFINFYLPKEANAIKVIYFSKMFYHTWNNKPTFDSDGDVWTSKCYDDTILVPLLADSWTVLGQGYLRFHVVCAYQEHFVEGRQFLYKSKLHYTIFTF